MLAAANAPMTITLISRMVSPDEVVETWSARFSNGANEANATSAGCSTTTSQSKARASAADISPRAAARGSATWAKPATRSSKIE